MVRPEVIFYIIGIVFLFSTVMYFSYEFLFSLSDGIKTVILVCLIVASFFGAEVLRERDR